MSFFKVDDILLSHWRSRVAGPAGIGMWTMGGIYCTTNLTDGHIPHVVAAALLPGAKGAIKKTLDSGLWINCEQHETCYLMRAYHQDSSGGKRQPTKAEAEAAKVSARERQRRRRRNDQGQFEEDFPLGDPDYVTPVSQRDTGGVTSTQSNPIQSEGSSDPSPERDEAAPRKNATRLPNDWMPTATHLAKARELGLNLEYQAETFRVHAATHDRRVTVWNGAFTQWLLHADPAKEPSGAKPKQSLRDRYKDDLL